MREIGFRGCARNIEAAGLGADPLEQLTRLADGHVLRVDRGADRAGGFIGGPELVARDVESSNRLVERSFTGRDRFEQLLTPRVRLAALLRSRGNPLLEVAGRVPQSQDFA